VSVPCAARQWVSVGAVLALLWACGAAPGAQRSTFGVVGSDEYTPDGSENQPYDGGFQFVRLSYRYGLSSFGGRRERLAPWAHDHPRADMHYMKILSELTHLRPRTTGSNTFALDDPELLRFPFAYMSEPGFWQPSESEVAGVRNYLLKGGFIIFDDFRGPDWEHLQRQMRRALPDLWFVELDSTHPLFHAFFEIPDLQVLEAPYGGMTPSYYGLFEENDPEGRLLAIADVNNDLGEYWEYSGAGFVPVDLSNEAYKFGVNYAMYAITH
jgi:hypothetical protein